MLQDDINRAIASYFRDASFRKLPVGIYAEIMGMVEKPLLESVLKAVKGNQVRAAEVLGFNRNTLRKYCIKYNIRCADYYIDDVRSCGHTTGIQTIPV